MVYLTPFDKKPVKNRKRTPKILKNGVKTKMKKAFSLFLALVMLVLSVPVFSLSVTAEGAEQTGNELPFTDVGKENWFYDAVKEVWTLGIMSGVSAAEFAPAGALSRAMFVTILGRLAGAPAEGFTPDTFPDTEKDAWYSPYVGWAMENGIVGGFEDGSFRPGDSMTREQMAKAIAVYTDASGIRLPRVNDAPYEFADEEAVAEWAKGYVDILRTSGIVGGDQNGNFNPKNSITRAEAAKIIVNLIEAENKEWQGYVPSPTDDRIILGAKYLYSNGTVVEGSLGTELVTSGDYPVLRAFRDELAEKWSYGQPADTTGFSMGWIAHVYRDYPIVKVCYSSDREPTAIFTTGSGVVNTEVLPQTAGEADGGYKTVYFDLTEAVAKYEGSFENHATHFLLQPFGEGEEETGFSVVYYGLFKNRSDAEAFKAADTADYLKNYFVYSAADYKELTKEQDRQFEETIRTRIGEILNSESELTPAAIEAEGGTCYYLSSINGDDSNDGLSPSTPWKSLSKLFLDKGDGVERSVPKPGDGVFFERGSEWYAERYHDLQVSCLGTKSGVSYGAYGTGKKPMFSCAIDFHGTNGNWLETEWENVWVLDQIDENESFCKEKCDIGNIIFNGGQYVGIRLKPDKDMAPFGTEGMETQYVGYCTNGMEFFTSGNTSYENPGTALQHNLEYIHDRCGGKLYLYWDGNNPAEDFDDIKVSRNGGCCWAENNTTFDNLAFLYSSNYGVNGTGDNILKGLTFTNCEVGFCNKSLDEVASGIELYGPVNGYTVRNCYFHEIGDGPMSAQFGGGEEGTESTIQNILWENNVVLCSGCGAECWISMDIDDETGESLNKLRNNIIRNNILAYVGWGLPQLHGASLNVGHVMNTTHSGGYMDENSMFENNLIYKPYDSIFYAYVRLDDQRHGWDARNNTYVASPECTAIAFEFETINRLNYRFYKYRRVFMPYNERYIRFMTANGMDPAAEYYWYDGITNAMKKGCFFTTSYYIERGIKPETY